MLRIQTACRLTVRLTWSVTGDHSHPQHTFTCVEDAEMALTAARRASEFAPHGIRLTGADVSPDGGRTMPWAPLDLSGGWVSGPCT